MVRDWGQGLVAPPQALGLDSVGNCLRRADAPRQGPARDVSVRALGAKAGPLSRERIVEFDAPNHQAYVIVSGPMPVKNYRADVRLTSTAEGGTKISWRGSWTTKVPLVSGFLTKAVRGFAVGAAREAERLHQQRS